MRDKNMLFKKSNISYIIDDGKPKKSKEIRHSLDYHIEKNKQKNKPADNILKE